MNKVALIGRLVRDPELKFLPTSGAATCTVTLAVDRYNSKTKQKEADFIPIVVWGKQAESVANYMSKGRQMGVIGRIQTRSYAAKDGTKRYVTEVVADAYGGIEFLGSKSNPQTDGENDMTPVNDDNVPF